LSWFSHNKYCNEIPEGCLHGGGGTGIRVLSQNGVMPLPFSSRSWCRKGEAWLVKVLVGVRKGIHTKTYLLSNQVEEEDFA